MPRAKQQRNVALARKLRSQLSLPEVLLWQHLRSQDEVKFRRQHPLGHYVLDFYCAEAKVCVEIDGIVHDMGDRAMSDLERHTWLRNQGIEVVRIAAADVFKPPANVAECLISHCRR